MSLKTFANLIRIFARLFLFVCILSLLYEDLDWSCFLQSYPTHELNGYPLKISSTVKPFSQILSPPSSLSIEKTNNDDVSIVPDQKEKACSFNDNPDVEEDKIIKSIRDEMFDSHSTKNTIDPTRLLPIYNSAHSNSNPDNQGHNEDDESEEHDSYNVLETSGIIIVTGSSTGIGYDMAVRLAYLGYHVIAGVRTEKDVQKFHHMNSKYGLSSVYNSILEPLIEESPELSQLKSQRENSRTCNIFCNKNNLQSYKTESEKIDCIERYKYIYHGWIHPVILDVTIDETIYNVKEYVIKLQTLLTKVSENGNEKGNDQYPLVGLVNNAGIAYISPIEIVDIEKVKYNLDVNVVGVLRCTKAFTSLLRKSKGRIINIGSAAGKIVPPLYGIYSATKFALEAITDALRMELRRFEMAVVLLQPGTVQSNIRQTTMTKYTFLNHEKENEKARNNEKETVNKEDTTALYGSYAERMESKAESLSEYAAPASIVSNKLFHALHSKHPKSRYMMGWFQATKLPLSPIIRVINSILPDYVQDAMKMKT